MIEALEKILNKIVVPMNDRLIGVDVRQMGMGEIYLITYIIRDRIDYQDGYYIERETQNMFNMLGPQTGESFIVQYKMLEEN